MLENYDNIIDKNERHGTIGEKPEICKGCLFEERDIDSGVCAVCAVSYCVRNGLDPESRIVKE